MEKLTKTFALFSFEQYFKAAQGDRNVGVTIYTEQREAYVIMDKINDGEISVTPAGSAGSNMPGLVSPDDGDALTLEGLSETGMFYQSSQKEYGTE